MARINFSGISVVTFMPDLLFLVVKFFLHRVKHVTLDHDWILEALALLILQWWKNLFWSDLLVKIFPVLLLCCVTGLSLFMNWLLHSLMAPSLCFKRKRVGEKKVWLTFYFACGPPIVYGQQNSDFENNSFWFQVREKKNPQVLSLHFGHPHYTIFYRLELTNVLRNHHGIKVRIHTKGYQEGSKPKSPLMAISNTLPTSLLSGEGCQVPAPSPLLLRAALCRASLGNNSPLVPSAGCQKELPAEKRENIILQPLNISWVQCATDVHQPVEKMCSLCFPSVHLITFGSLLFPSPGSMC